MPATVEGLIILFVFVMPGFITVRTRQLLVPTIEKSDAIQITLQSVTASLLYLPLWLLVSPQLLRFRSEIIQTVARGSVESTRVFWVGLGIFLLLLLTLPVATGLVWAIGSWNNWYERLARRIYPKLKIPAPVSGVGEVLWDRLWLNRTRKPWLTVYMKDGRIYVGQGTEFSLSPHDRELLLGAATRMFDEEWNLVRDLSTARGEGVWIPGSQIVSIDIHE